MEVSRVGFILYVRKYKECIVFYKEIMKLDILFRNEELACFDLYGTYLMVEKEDRDEFLTLKKDHAKAFSCIRINIDDVK